MTDLKNFDDLKDHFEQYAHYILKGYNIILVSHSQGNLYANQAMRRLKSYTDGSLTGTLDEKRAENPLFPEFYDIFANVQVASPVNETVNETPYFTFPDDAVMNWVRKVTGTVLPGNLSTKGAAKDRWGHSFVDAYFHVAESREKILAAIRSSYQRLKYPIAYFQDAVALGSDRIKMSDDPLFFFDFERNDGGWYENADEKYPNQRTIRHISFARCFDLKPGSVKIKGTVSFEKKPPQSSMGVNYLVWADGDYEIKASEAKTLNARESGSWEYGDMEIQKGGGKEPLSVKVTFYEKPIKSNQNRKD